MNKQKWIEYALQEGFSDFEIYQSLSSEKKVTWYEGQMDTFVTSRVLGTALRGTYQSQMVNLATEDTSDDQMERLIRQMKEQAAVISTEETAAIAAPAECEETASTKNWVRPGNELIKKTLAELEEKIAKADPRIIQVIHLSWNEEDSSREIVNSKGMRIFEENHVQLLQAGAAAASGNEVKNDYRVEVIEDLSAFDTEAFAKKLAEDVVNKLDAVQLASGTYPVIFEKGAMTSLFAAFSDLFSGDLIGKGISPLRDSLNTKIFSDLITVIDDPRNTDAVMLANYDDEGTPTYRKALVEAGVFKTILHSSRSAARMNMTSTGSGYKGSYAAPVDVSMFNCYIVPGEKSLDELCADMKDGYVITDLAGLHAGIDFVTTNFSLQCSGYWVKDGKRDHSVSLVTVAANFLEMMKQVTAVGSDLDWKYHSIVTPSIAFQGCAISGK